MKLPKRWLMEYVDFNVSDEDFIEKMMWRGFELASVEPELPGVDGVVVGKVLEIKKHENSDHLNICRVDVGMETLQIVTGAQNVTAGVIVPVALVGAVLGGHKMEPVNMRGVDSYGMLCSGSELGLTDADYPGSEVHGILLLREDYPLGQPIAKALGMDSVVFDFDLTPNRPDCASILGICREAAAALGQDFHAPKIKAVAGEGNAADYAAVTVENSDLCPRYCARVVTDIRIAPSPAWLVKKLRSVGLRSINNIVDITNFVMVEYGHPMHAFDLACVKDGQIVVRNAHPGEIVTTLDDKTRATDPEMLLIADPEKGVGVAGVMGGQNSEITDGTKAVLFEAAVFKSSSIRKTARALHLMTDAASHFIRGVEPVSAKNALDRAIELVVELGAGKVVGKPIDVCAADLREREVDVDVEHINRLLALDLSSVEMARMLKTIGISSLPLGKKLHVTVPHSRTDIESGIEADWDIAEEIARIYGYYNIEPTLMRGNTFRGGLSPEFQLDDLAKDTLCAQGAYEMYNYNFTGPAALDNLRLPADDELRCAVRILNPFGEDQSLMRTTLYIGMLDTGARNINRHTEQGRFFEVGNVHIDNDPVLPEERKKAGLLYFGENESFFTLKGSIEALLSACGVTGASFAPTDRSYFQPGRAAVITAASGVMLGELGQIHPETAKVFGIDCPVYAAELSMATLLSEGVSGKKFKPLPRFPVVLRDVAVVVDRDEQNARLVSAIENAKTPVIVENAKLFDVYSGLGVLPGKKSMAYTFSLRAEDHTLTDEEIHAAMDAVIAALEACGAALRS